MISSLHPPTCAVTDTTSASNSYRPGDVLGKKYRLERMAAEGGMGTVWVALNTDLDTHVAIKVLRGDTPQLGAVERLLREARAAAKLRHPAIVRVFDFGVTPRREPYIVMELLDGESLRDALAREGRYTPERSVQLMLPVAEALAAAHARGIVHRDLKPDNIVLATDDGGKVQPKVVDFGVAKLLRASAETGATGLSVVGTPEYMSPEQAVGLDVDPRADVWAFCVVLYELITDAYLFTGETAEQTFQAVLHDPAPPLVGINGVDQDLWRIIERGLRKDRDERWLSIRRLGRELAQWLLQRGIAEDIFGASIRSSWANRSLVEAIEAERKLAQKPAIAASSLPPEPAAEADATPAPVAAPETEPDPVARPDEPAAGAAAAPASPPAPPRRLLGHAPRLRAMAPSMVVAVAGVLVWALAGAKDSMAPSAVAAPAAPVVQLEPLPRDLREIEDVSAAVTASASVPEPATAPPSRAAPSSTTKVKAHPPAKARRPTKYVRPEEVDFGF